MGCTGPSHVGGAEVVHMRRAFVLFFLAALPAVVAAAQSRPNFNGRWVAIQSGKIADGRLVVEQLHPPVSQDPDRASETVLDVRRVVYERR